MKIVIFIEHDIVVRHFVHSNVFADLVRQHDVTFVFPEPGYKRVTIDVSKLELHGARYRHLVVHQKRLEIWKRLFQVDMLRWRRDPVYTTLRKLHREMMGPKAAALYSVLGLPGIYQWLRRRSFSRIADTPYTDLETLLDEENPDLLIHPSVLEGVYINDLVETSKARDIPFIVIMNSWDNPCSKRARVGIPDWLLVWGPQTHQHALDYAGTPASRTIQFGAAQFEVYRDPPRIDRNTFCARHDIDPGNRILLYAGSSKGTDEFAHLREIDDAVESGRLPQTTVVYRPHPWGNGGLGGEGILNHAWRHVRIESTMRGYLEAVRDGNQAMTFPDYRDTRDTLKAIDALVSPLSTIVVEAALVGKPALCFLPMEEADARHFQLIMPLKHFEDMFNMSEFLIARSRDELIPGLEKLLERVDDAEFEDQLHKAAEHFITPHEQPYAGRLTRFCEDVIAAGSPSAQHTPIL
jgi:hypothetical protein